MYMLDVIVYVMIGGMEYFFLVNEGDLCDYIGYIEVICFFGVNFDLFIVD